jgi:hypothetical protein
VKMMTNNEKHPFKCGGVKVRIKIEIVTLKGNHQKNYFRNYYYQWFNNFLQISFGMFNHYYYFSCYYVFIMSTHES